MITGERVVQRLQQLRRARVVRSDDDTVRLHEVRDCGAFFKEFRIRNDVELGPDAAFTQCLLDSFAHSVSGAHRHRGLVHDDPVAVHVAADRLGDGQHVREVGRAILLGRRADGDELEEAVRDPVLGAGCEDETALLDIAPDDVIEPWLVDRDLALLKPGHLAGVDIHADDVVAGLGEAGTGNKPHVTRTKYCNFHF